ncbi:MAG: CDGSH iron-sulfur domain-containing protein [Planctomycetota bacterium]|nr:CDGSH iron-sulfur domain-containing protein [Planctomycetota bacterium]MDA1251248.1 CDGSH iron-sulfur domain-containing protein [Planctomycetota bacterium]
MSEVTIRCRKDGPLIVTGPAKVTDTDGNEYDTSGKENIALCRCGVSGNRPFCDGSHRASGFQSDDSARA